MIRVAGVMAVTAILTPTFAWADWNYAHWGMTPDQVAQASGGAVEVLAPAMRTQHDAPFDSVTAAKGTYVEGALKLSMSLSFDLTTNGLSCIIFETEDSSQNESLKESFVRRYGPPQTTGGAPDLGMDSFAWYKPDEVMVTLMNDTGSFASVCKPGTQPPFES